MRPDEPVRSASLPKAGTGAGAPSVPLTAARLDAVTRAIAGVSELAIELGEHIEAPGVNPLIGGQDGAVAVDALAVPRRTVPAVS
jgi:hypothetical protein